MRRILLPLALLAACASPLPVDDSLALQLQDGVLVGHNAAAELDLRWENGALNYDSHGVQLRLAAWGRAELTSLGDTAPTPVCGGCARAEQVRDGLVEWWVNDERGLEQGFDLLARPDGDGPVRLMLQVSAPVLVDTPTSARFLTGLDSIRYDRLKAWDDTGNDLEATFASVPGGLEIRVDDAGATWPIHVDPMSTSGA